jgi:hypothetical protein
VDQTAYVASLLQRNVGPAGPGPGSYNVTEVCTTITQPTCLHMPLDVHPGSQMPRSEINFGFAAANLEPANITYSCTCFQ